MQIRSPHFRAGIGLTVLIAVASLVVARVPGLDRIGPLSLALLLGMLWRGLAHVPVEQHAGIGFSARRLLRCGIILLGVRLDFALLAHSGWRIMALDLLVVTFGVLFIHWLGKRAGLEGRLPILLAMGSSICGASAVAATAPVVRARDEEIALAIPLCGVLGTAATLGLQAAQHALHLAPATYGILAGSTLHEVAQVMAATASIPAAIDDGTIVKLMRVLLLVPIVLWLSRMTRTKELGSAPVQMPWFVGGFLLVGLAHTVLTHALPQFHLAWSGLDAKVLVIANFLMTMALAGLGLQADLGKLRTQGMAALGVAVVGWLALVVVAAGGMWLLKL